jgi:hypothetical protein
MGLLGRETIDTPDESEEVNEFNKEHVEIGSSLEQEVLDTSNNRVGNFVKVMPLSSVHDYLTRCNGRTEPGATAELIKINAEQRLTGILLTTGGVKSQTEVRKAASATA